MDFIAAYMEMTHGKKVKRRNWNKSNCLSLNKEGVYSSSDGHIIKMKKYLIEATDWEIYEECKFCQIDAGARIFVTENEKLTLCEKHSIDNWNLADNNAVDSDIPIERELYHKNQIKTFIQKIKEDIDTKPFDINKESIIGHIQNIIDKRSGSI